MSPKFQSGPRGLKPGSRKGLAPAQDQEPQRVSAFRLLIEYDGGRFAGWQKQGPKQTAQGVRTVAGIIEKILHDAGHQTLKLMGSGRTDAGVHSLGQVAHLHLSEKGAPKAGDLQRIFNDALPHDLAVREIRPCSAAFHARHDAMERTYLYQLSCRRSAFADLEPKEDPRCQIRACEWAESGSLILLRTTATHFLRSQVRRMLGAAVACALGDENPESISMDLRTPSEAANLRWGRLAAPSAGLFLEYVRYTGDPPVGPFRPVVDVY